MLLVLLKLLLRHGDRSTVRLIDKLLFLGRCFTGRRGPLDGKRHQRGCAGMVGKQQLSGGTGRYKSGQQVGVVGKCRFGCERW